MNLSEYNPNRYLLCQPEYWEEMLAAAHADMERVQAASAPGWREELVALNIHAAKVTVSLEHYRAEQEECINWTSSQWMEAVDRTREDIAFAQANTEMTPQGKALYLIELKAMESFYQGMVNQALESLLYGETF